MDQSQFARRLAISAILVQYTLASSISFPIDPRDEENITSYAAASSINPLHSSAIPTWNAPSSYSSSSDPNGANTPWTNGTVNAIDLLPKGYTRVCVAHAVLACTAFLILFPLGGIIPRLGIRPMAQLVPLHVGIQMFAYAVFAAAAGMGIWMARNIQEVSGYHPIGGMIILGLLSIQPLIEILNAILYRPERHEKIIVLGHIHIWLGRVLITAGIINGGLGFLFGRSFPWNTRPLAPRIIYGVAGLFVWLTYVLIAVVWPYLRSNGFKLEDLKFRGRVRSLYQKRDVSLEDAVPCQNMAVRDGGIKHPVRQQGFSSSKSLHHH